MLISFSVANYRSFGEEQTLNMVASGKIVDHPDHLVPIGQTGKSVVRAAVIYGANAAGKSNLVRAMEFAQRAILGKNSLSASTEPFRFISPDDLTSSFEFRFLAAESLFTYGFDVKGRAIQAEWLTVLRGNEDVVIYERDSAGQTEVANSLRAAFPDDESLQDTLWVLAKLQLRPEQLLLNRAIGLPETAQGKTLSTVIGWLTRDLLILRPDHRTHDLLDRLDQDAAFLLLAAQFLEGVGTGVSGLAIEKTERDASEIERQAFGLPNANNRLWKEISLRSSEMDVNLKPDDPNRVISRRLVAQHSSNGLSPCVLPFSEESDGTRQLLHLMPVLDSRGNGPKVIVIDELDRSLHPLICWEFLRFFSETRPGAHKQLIVTTHEAHLLNQELLRRDEYWFVEKDKQQQSRLVPLSEFKVRNDLQIEKGYLQGRFGAIPVIGSMTELESLVECRVTPETTDATAATAP